MAPLSIHKVLMNVRKTQERNKKKKKEERTEDDEDSDEEHRRARPERFVFCIRKKTSSHWLFNVFYGNSVELVMM